MAAEWLSFFGEGVEALYDESIGPIGTCVLTLIPEWTRDGNRTQVWVWKLPGPHAQETRFGITYGVHADKETARQDGLDALRRYGGSSLLG